MILHRAWILNLTLFSSLRQALAPAIALRPAVAPAPPHTLALTLILLLWTPLPQARALLDRDPQGTGLAVLQLRVTQVPPSWVAHLPWQSSHGKAPMAKLPCSHICASSCPPLVFLRYSGRQTRQHITCWLAPPQPTATLGT